MFARKTLVWTSLVVLAFVLGFYAGPSELPAVQAQAPGYSKETGYSHGVPKAWGGLVGTEAHPHGVTLIFQDQNGTIRVANLYVNVAGGGLNLAATLERR